MWPSYPTATFTSHKDTAPAMTFSPKPDFFFFHKSPLVFSKVIMSNWKLWSTCISIISKDKSYFTRPPHSKCQKPTWYPTIPQLDKKFLTFWQPNSSIHISLIRLHIITSWPQNICRQATFCFLIWMLLLTIFSPYVPHYWEGKQQWYF